MIRYNDDGTSVFIGDERMKIAICDDENEIIQKTKHDILTLQLQDDDFEFFEFKSGENLLSSFTKDYFDMIVLDIEMSGINGLETAELIRKTDENVIIIFLTSYDNFVYKGYEVRAFRYILKEQPKPIYMKQFKDAIEEYYQKNRFIIIETKQGTVKIFINSIIFIEVFAREIFIHTKEKSYTVIGRLKNFAEALPKRLFVKIDKSHIINVHNIETISKSNVILKNGETLTVSRNHRQSLNETFVSYIKSRC
jgi:DNA-binding LytR/AlgR family response regulator